jgi:DNA-binding response OmpR family regulator
MTDGTARRKRILIADDEEHNLELFEACMEPLGHETVRAMTGIEALALLERIPIDLLLLDVMMPGATGFEVLRRFRERPTQRCVPVVLLTALGDRPMRLRGLELGANEFMTKPIDRAELVARVKTLLSLQDANDALIERTQQLGRLQAFQRYLVNYLVRDLRKPLAVLRENLASMRAARLRRDLVGVVDDSRAATDRMIQMLSDVIEAAKMEDGATALGSLTPESLRSLSTEVARERKRSGQSS